MPVLPYTRQAMQQLAVEIIKSQIAVTGAQPKLSLDLKKINESRSEPRFTIVGLWGGYILKPPTDEYPSLPELESLTMHLAEISGIQTVPHSLIRLQDGELAYITRRIDRLNGRKVPMEDMCQLTEKMTEQKYQGSYEQIGKKIQLYSANPGLGLIDFMDVVLFSFLTGNADMHFKNFSLIQNKKGEFALSPAYDLVASALVVEEDDEDLALNLRGKKKKITKNDFFEAASTLQIPERSIENLFVKYQKVIPKWSTWIEGSFLPTHMKKAYQDLILSRSSRMDLTL